MSIPKTGEIHGFSIEKWAKLSYTIYNIYRQK